MKRAENEGFRSIRRMGIRRAALISIWLRVEPRSVADHGNDQFLKLEF